MTQVCDPVPLDCSYCYVLELVQSDTLTVDAGLTPASMVYVWITTKFSSQYMVSVVVAGDGSFDLDASDFPNGMFNPDAGYFDLFVSSDIDGSVVVPMTFGASEYNCVLLSIVCCQGIGCMEIESTFIIS